MIWYKESKDSDIIVSTRIRLARNLSKYPFPQTISEKDKEEVEKKVKDAISGSNSTLSKEFKFVKMSDLKPSEREELAERHLISRDMSSGDDGAVFRRARRVREKGEDRPARRRVFRPHPFLHP